MNHQLLCDYAKRRVENALAKRWGRANVDLLHVNITNPRMYTINELNELPLLVKIIREAISTGKISSEQLNELTLLGNRLAESLSRPLSHAEPNHHSKKKRPSPTGGYGFGESFTHTGIWNATDYSLGTMGIYTGSAENFTGLALHDH